MKVDAFSPAETQIQPTMPETCGQLSLEFGTWDERDAATTYDRTDSIGRLILRRQEEDRVHEEWDRFFVRAVTEVYQQPYEGRVVRGPLYKEFNQVFEAHTKAVAEKHPTLNPECFFPPGYLPPTAKLKVDKVFGGQESVGYRNAAKVVRTAKATAIEKALAPHMADLLNQTIPEGLLDVPGYRSMPESRSCTATSFMMIMDDILGEKVDEWALLGVLGRGYSTLLVPDEEFLKLLQSNVFKNRSGKNIQTASFAGADYKLIGNLAERLRATNPDRKIYCVLSTQSDTSSATRELGIWHSAVLLGADEHSVRAHVPLTKYRHFDGERTRREDRGSNLTIPKLDFTRRWGQAHMRGHLIIVD